MVIERESARAGGRSTKWLTNQTKIHEIALILFIDVNRSGKTSMGKIMLHNNTTLYGNNLEVDVFRLIYRCVYMTLQGVDKNQVFIMPDRNSDWLKLVEIPFSHLGNHFLHTIMFMRKSGKTYITFLNTIFLRHFFLLSTT